MKDVAVLGLLLMPLACGPSPSRQSDGSDAAAAPPTATSRPGSAAARPDLTPPALTPAAERSETGARNLLLSFARAIELARYDQARALLSPADQSRWSAPAFAAIFADLAEVTVAVPAGQLDGAAGEGRFTAPVTVSGRDRDGRPVRIEGTAVLRQAAGAAGEPPRWRFETLSLDVTH